MQVLERAVWSELERAHAERIDAATAAYRGRKASGGSHPVEDFLFTYYSHRPAALRRWHPGAGVVLRDATGAPRAGWRWYRVDGDDVTVDVARLLAAREPTVRFVRDLLGRTLERPAHLGCFGLHEWAMVHRVPQDSLRHAGWRLRLGPAATDDVVESHQLGCTHFDAFRFFTASTAPRNTVVPTRERQSELEQPGCLHAGMDCYKWAYTLSPATPSGLVADCFDLAREIRVLDMRASPYDLTELGYEPVAVETRAGKAAYLTAQREFADRSQALRRRLLSVCDTLLARELG